MKRVVASGWWGRAGWFFPLLSVLLAAAFPTHVLAQSQLTAEVGFDGVFKAGYWTPIRVRATAGESPLRGELELATLDGDGVEVRYDGSQVIDLQPGETGEWSGLVRFGRVQPQLSIALRASDSGAEVTRADVSVGQGQRADRFLALTLGASVGVEQSFVDPSFQAIRLEEAATLPSSWLGYEGVNLLVLSTVENQVLEEMSEAQFAALDRWVKMGGQLLLCVGKRGDQLFSEEGNPGLRRLARFVPGTFSGVVPLRNSGALESRAGSVRVEGTERIFSTLIQDVTGEIVLSELGVRGVHPLFVRSTYGLGNVRLATVDLDQPPLATWAGRSRFLSQLLGEEVEGNRVGRDEPISGKTAHVGYTDLAGQLRNALDQFGGVSLIPFYWVAGLVFVYAVLLGPGDYFFLSRVLKRMEWTWITFPALAILFVMCAVVLRQQFKRPEFQLHQIDLVDVDLPSQQIRGTTWATLYSPQTELYDLEWQREPDLRDFSGSWATSFTWHGLPGSGLGGFDTNSRPPRFAEPYLVGQPGSGSALIRELPVQVASSKALLGRWWAETEVSDSKSLRVDRDGLLQGVIENPLPKTLESCYLVYRNWLYRFQGSQQILAPGESVDIARQQLSNLEWRLTERRSLELNDVSSPWNQQVTELPRILQVMMWYEAAGGDNYTRMRNRYQGYIDLSRHLQQGRAILIGKTDAPATSLVVEGETQTPPPEQSWTLYRVLFAVDEAEDPSR